MFNNYRLAFTLTPDDQTLDDVFDQVDQIVPDSTSAAAMMVSQATGVTSLQFNGATPVYCGNKVRKTVPLFP